MRVLFIFLFITSLNLQANEDWFQYQEHTQTYNVDAINIHPSAFFKYLSFYTGIGIQYDQSISTPINFYGKNTSQQQLIQFLESEFSTLLTYKKNKNNENILTNIAILPKGQFQSDNMVMAIDPVQEAITAKSDNMPTIARPVYQTRLESMEEKIRDQVERLAEKRIESREYRKQKMERIAAEKQTLKQQRLAELAELKVSDPKLYERTKAIYFPQPKQDQ
ncbi:MAG: hypothetical protein HWE18_06715 [Gammaproteobacteria bacterium]|nr:hypothetical protein [Gammaproteobacteria bacterium]